MNGHKLKNNAPKSTFTCRKRTLDWLINKWLVEHMPHKQSFSKRPGRLKTLIVSEKDKICQSQIFPFYFYKSELVDRWNIDLKEIRLFDYESAPEKAPGDADVVLLQTWFDIKRPRLDAVISMIRKHNPNAKLVFLDSFAPTDLRLADWLNNNVDLYLKKHLLRDRSRYFVPTRGDTNLVDFYGRLYDFPYDEKLYPVPDGFLEKLIVGPTFSTASYMLPYFASHSEPKKLPDQWDIHGRLAFKGSDWYQTMRQQAIAAMESMEGYSILSRTGVSRKQYFNELRSSKMCFSPFGYGEVCWRDYEAVLCGSLLIKPDMSHMETYPDIFVAHETYVPVKWDFSDFKEVAEYYLSHENERKSIAKKAYDVLHEYSRSDRFLEQMAPIFAV